MSTGMDADSGCGSVTVDLLREDNNVWLFEPLAPFHVYLWRFVHDLFCTVSLLHQEPFPAYGRLDSLTTHGAGVGKGITLLSFYRESVIAFGLFIFTSKRVCCPSTDLPTEF